MPNDFEKLQGAWRLTALEVDSRAMPAGGGIEIDGDRFRAVGMGWDYAGKVELDEAKRPKRLDLIFTEGPEAGNRNQGIYRLAGDAWTVCLNFTGKARPRAFASGGGNALEVFERGAIADVAPEPIDVHAEGEGELVGEWEMVEAHQEGHPLDPRMVKTGRRVTTATHTTTYFAKQVFMQARYTTDPTCAPKAIDLVSKDRTQLGIYEVAGDTMKICFGAPGGPRPTDFEARAGDGRTSAVWQRVKGSATGA